MIRLLNPSLFICSLFPRFLPGMCLVGMLSLFPSPSHSYAAFNGVQVEPHTIPLDQILSGGPPKDGIPALMSPQFLPADEVDFLSPEDRVLGIQGTHQAKAYPIAILNWHEIVNDTLEETPVVITYCPLCGTGMGFRRKVGNQLLTFGVSGLLYQNDVLMYDHQSESLWSQISMEAVTGPSLGQHLEPIFLEHTTWKAWYTHHPDTVVLSQQTGFSRDYHRDPYQHYALSDQVMFPLAKQDVRLSVKDWVLGVEIDGKSKAYPFSILEEINEAFSDSLNGTDYIVCWDSHARSAKVLDHRSKPFPSLTAYWFAWYAFHPDTDIVQIPSIQTKLKQKIPNSVC